MVHRVYTIKDRVANQHGPCFQAINDGVASRSMVQLLAKVPKYDRDAFELYCIGEFDDADGEVVGTGKRKVEYDIPRFEDLEAQE